MGSALLVVLMLFVHAEAAVDKALVWGTYRPQIYFGIRAARPDSFLSGLVWFPTHSLDAFSRARHECSEDDRLGGYGWTYHDGRSLAVQEIRDTENNYLLKTSWLKTTSEASKGAGSWAVRIEGRVIDESRPASLSTIYYAALESSNAAFQPTFEKEKYIDGLPSKGDDLPDGRFFVANKAGEDLPGFSMRFTDTPGFKNSPPRPELNEQNLEHEAEFISSRSHWHYFGAGIPKESLWRGKDVILSDISTSVKQAFSSYGQDALPSPADLLTLKDGLADGSNFVALQRSFTGNFSLDVFYDSEDSPASSLLDGQSLSVALEASKQAYQLKFDQVLPPQEIGADSAQRQNFARELTSQIVGSVGYYHGQSIVDRSFTHDYDDIAAEPKPADPQLTPPSELLTATPSRSKFPRGFYWDEGFHLAHIGVWDPSLSLEILRSWINLIDEDGWVAREQILGEEARSRVPSEFQTQYPTYANPPTLAIIVTDYLNRLEERHSDIFPLEASDVGDAEAVLQGAASSSSYIEDPLVARDFLTSIYPKLRTHYLWFRSSQRGQIKEWDRSARARNEAFRWRGRTKDHVLTSGLDDYPRAPTPHVGELHLDLHCWMGSFAEAMIKVARALGEDDDAEEYERSYKGIVANVDDLHWNEAENMFCDASVDENDESFHVCHRGYISLFPLLSQVLSVDNPHLDGILDMMYDPQHLWSSFGLRSLSKQDEFFGKGEDYWRGPIWMPMNYLVLRALKKKYAALPGPYQAKAAKVYAELRTNVVNNVLKEYERTGYTWEQYHPETGHGQRSHPFTGWTSMTAMIMSEIY
jgi:mannosyl-oligosaccharide glucosidase